MKTCSIEGCNRKHDARGWCKLHYRRWYSHGDPRKTLRPKRDPICLIEGCNGSHSARGWCNTHYKKWLVHGDPHYIRPQQPQRLCSIEGCNEKHEARGWCYLHYTRWRLHGDPDYVVRPHRLAVGEANRNSVLKQYKESSGRRGIFWGLSDEQCICLFQGNCHYCGCVPSRERTRQDLNGSYFYNGIDRVDNSKGYILGNVVSCCWDCNNTKGLVTMDIAQKMLSHKEQSRG